MEFVTNRLGYWMRRIKDKFPEVYDIIPVQTRALFSVQRMVKGKYVLSTDVEKSPKEQQIFGTHGGVISYTYEPSWGYIGLEFCTTKGVHKSLAFDMEKLHT
jgi:hypothetical protein